MNARKRLLLFATKLSYQTRMFKAAAEKLGVDLAFVTDRCNRLDDPWNDRAIGAHFENPEAAAQAVLQAQRELPVDGVLAIGDRPGPTAAYVARSLGILHNHPASVEACRNKLRMREVLRDAGLPVPAFRSVALHPLPEPALLGIAFPCVLKPLSLSASQGVVRANNREEFLAGAIRLKHLLESPEIRATHEPGLDRMLVESYLPGREVAVEGLITEGQPHLLAIFDKPDPLEGPYFEETIYVTPSRLPVAVQGAIVRCAQRSITALGLSRGPLHAEFRVNERGPWVLELQPRPIGGLCARALRFGPHLMALEELLCRHALGEDVAAFEREPAASGVMMIPVPHSGIFEGVEGLEEAARVPGIESVEITARLHDYVAAWPEGASYLGFIFARDSGPAGPATVESGLRAAHACLHFDLRPRLPVEHPLAHRAEHG